LINGVHFLKVLDSLYPDHDLDPDPDPDHDHNLDLDQDFDRSNPTLKIA
jgi:hypothetical protein